MLELASRSDVSLLVTTHSPYAIARESSTRVTEPRMNGEGVTCNAGTALGSDDRSERLGSLYRDPGMAGVFERALSIPNGCRGVLITEGYTDGALLRIACRAAERDESPRSRRLALGAFPIAVAGITGMLNTARTGRIGLSRTSHQSRGRKTRETQADAMNDRLDKIVQAAVQAAQHTKSRR